MTAATDDLAAVRALRAALWSNGFRPVPVKTRGKAPVGMGWGDAARANPPAATRLPVAPHAVSTGILCDGLRAIDIDVDDQERADEIEALANGMFGFTITRTRANSGKRLLVYRATEGAPPKRAITGEHGKIEALGKGQQFVGYGVHPSGALYEWRGDDPTCFVFGALTAISEDELSAFLDACAGIIGAKDPAGNSDIGITITERKQSLAPQNTLPVAASGQSDFFRIVNDKALANIGGWVGSIFPGAKRQDGTGAYRISSKQLGRSLQEDLSISPDGIVDFGVADMGDARQGKRTPIDIVIDYGMAGEAVGAARWMCDRLGVDPDSIWKRNDGEILDVTPLLRSRAAVMAEEIDDTDDDEPDDDGEDGAPLDEDLTRVPGLLGDLIEAITKSARRPNRRLALAAALPILGTVIGRRIATPTHSGTHLYVIATGATAMGKQHPLNCIERFMGAAQLGRHVGPSQFMSMSALNKHAEGAPLSICPQDEFGAVLKRLSHPRASGHEMGISMVLRMLWGSSFGIVRTPAYATARSVEIASPSLSLFAPTTPEELYSGLKGSDVVNGFLNRFLIIDSGDRAAECEPLEDVRKAAERLAPQLARAYRIGAPKRGNMAAHIDKNTDPDPEPLVIPWASQSAHDDYLDLSNECLRRIDANHDTGAMYGRTAEIAVRLATIAACGQDHDAPTVTADNMAWAARLALQSAELASRAADRHMIDPLGAAEFERKIIEKLQHAPGRKLRMRGLHRAMSKHFRFAGDLKKTLDAMQQAGLISQVARIVPGGKSITVALT